MSKKIGTLTLYTVEELAQTLQVQPKTIRAYLQTGKIKGRKIAKRWYITEESLQEFFSQPEPAKDGQDASLQQALDSMPVSQ